MKQKFTFFALDDEENYGLEEDLPIGDVTEEEDDEIDEEEEDDYSDYNQED